MARRGKISKAMIKMSAWRMRQKAKRANRKPPSPLNALNGLLDHGKITPKSLRYKATVDYQDAQRRIKDLKGAYPVHVLLIKGDKRKAVAMRLAAKQIEEKSRKKQIN